STTTHPTPAASERTNPDATAAPGDDRCGGAAPPAAPRRPGRTRTAAPTTPPPTRPKPPEKSTPPSPGCTPPPPDASPSPATVPATCRAETAGKTPRWSNRAWPPPTPGGYGTHPQRHLPPIRLGHQHRLPSHRMTPHRLPEQQLLFDLIRGQVPDASFPHIHISNIQN